MISPNQPFKWFARIIRMLVPLFAVSAVLVAVGIVYTIFADRAVERKYQPGGDK